MRRIHIAMVALGLVGVLGVTIAQTAAQPAPASGIKAPITGPAVPPIPPAAATATDIMPPPPDHGPEINLPPTVADVAMPPVAPAAAVGEAARGTAGERPATAHQDRHTGPG